jgi:hypothetical protein
MILLFILLQILSETFNLFMEDLTIPMLLAGSLMAFGGNLFRVVLGATDRDPASTRTPYKFSWRFLFSDNARRFYNSTAASILAVFFSLRFSNQLFGTAFSMVFCFLLGFGLDKLIQNWKEIRRLITFNRGK